MSAQRLSASQRGAFGRDRYGPTARCSTPFGITEWGMSKPDFIILAREGAQRLSASQSGASGGRIAPPSSGCAQRLSASQRGACRPAGVLPVERRRVLNAFRHHRGGHAALFAADVSLRVLNAFRHHRGGHPARPPRRATVRGSAQRLSASQRGACVQPGAADGATSVLNAFRHHRGGHVSPATWANRPSAQRLSASQRGAFVGQHLGRTAACAQRLSASQRGACSNHSPDLSCPEIAQRLSASQRGACDEDRGDDRRTAVLNAFWHHRGGHEQGTAA